MAYLKQLYILKVKVKLNKYNMGSVKVFKKHTYCTSFDKLSAGFHMISALHIGVW